MSDHSELKRMAEASPKKRCPIQSRAHRMVRDAIKYGRMVRPENCQKCGDNPGKGSDGRSKIQGHHHKGYDFPLDVEWICAACHRMETPFNVPKGTEAKATKLTESDILDIRTKRMSQAAFANLYSVAQSNICYIQNRKTWTHFDAAIAKGAKP